MIPGLNKRERNLILMACIFIFAAGVYNFGISPFIDKKKDLERRLEVKKSSLSEINLLRLEYEKTLNKNKILKDIYSQREKNFTLFAFLEKLAVKAGVDGAIDYMKPSSSTNKISEIELSLVEMKLKGIKMSQLTSYLYLVETSKNIVFVKRLAISQDGKDKKMISVVLHVETVKT